MAEYRVSKRFPNSAETHVDRALKWVPKSVDFWIQLDNGHPRVLCWSLESFVTLAENLLGHHLWLILNAHLDALWYPVFVAYFWSPHGQNLAQISLLQNIKKSAQKHGQFLNSKWVLFGATKLVISYGSYITILPILPGGRASPYLDSLKIGEDMLWFRAGSNSALVWIGVGPPNGVGLSS